MSSALVIASAFLVSLGLSAQTFSRVYAGTDSRSHVVARNGQDDAVPKEIGQVSVNSPKLSGDKRMAGWTVETENCCTSYPIPTSVVLYSFAGRHAIGDGLMIYDWCFVPGKHQVALSTGTVHGWTGGAHFALFSGRSGKFLQRWSGETSAGAPLWARCLTR